MLAAGVVLLGSAVLGFHVSEILAERSLATTVISTGLWTELVEEVGGKVVTRGERVFAELNALPIVGGTAAVGVCLWLVGSSLLAMVSRKRWTRSLAEFGRWGWLWWLTPIVFGLLDFAGTTGWLGTEVPLLLRGTLPFWNAALFAGWGATWIALAVPDVPAEKRALHSPSTIPAAVWGAMAVFTVAFGWMNWRLYDALLLPHGDSAMYEEHLWNLLHGKEFRSYLDNGRLFLGEHVQVVHLLLMPLYLLWPSHVLLELCQTLALAAGAIPVYRLAFRATDSRRVGCMLALTYLLYFPMQFLDIAIDFKTFRPNGFEIPFLLFALDAMESRRFRGMWVWLLLAMSCQEDAATVIAPLGLWIACCPSGKELPDGGVAHQRARWSGWALAAGGTLWVLLVIKVILPWFRGGADVHFAQYFSDLGENTDSIVSTVFQRPMAVIARVFRAESGLFAIALLAPLGGLSLLSPGRLAVAVPLFGVLCLSDITDSPQHHFHAPLVPILFWAAAHGFPRGARWGRGLSERLGFLSQPSAVPATPPPVPLVANGRQLPTSSATEHSAGTTVSAGAVLRYLRRRAHRLAPSRRESACLVAVAVWCLVSAAVTGFWIGLSPASLAFWDPHSSAYWRKMYVPGERARQIATVLQQIPATARVASTDLAHPRFTHYERSYDYSSYRPIVPEDCEYIVIDVKAPGSGIRGPADVRELRDDPDRWRLLPDKTNGYFLILQRR